MNIVILSIFLLAIFVLLCYNQQPSRPLFAKLNSTDNKAILGGSDVINILIMIFVALIFAVLCAFRSEHTNDYAPYLKYFDSILVDNGNFFKVQGEEQGFRIGFMYIVKFSKLFFGNDFRVFCFIVPLINLLVVAVVLFSIKGINPTVGFCTYLTVFGFYYNYIVLRQGLAISLIAISLWLIIKNKKLLGSIFIVLSAILFHESAVIILAGVIIVSLSSKKISTKAMISILVLSVFLYFTKIATDISVNFAGFLLDNHVLPQSFNKYVLYITDVEHSYDISIMHLINFALTFYLVYRSRIIDTNKARPFLNMHKNNCKNKSVSLENNDFPLWYNRMLVFSVMGQFIMGAFSSITVFVRLADYFLVSNIFLLSYSGENNKKAINRTALILYLFLCLFFILRIIFIMYRGVPSEI